MRRAPVDELVVSTEPPRAPTASAIAVATYVIEAVRTGQAKSGELALMFEDMVRDLIAVALSAPADVPGDPAAPPNTARAQVRARVEVLLFLLWEDDRARARIEAAIDRAIANPSIDGAGRMHALRVGWAELWTSKLLRAATLIERPRDQAIGDAPDAPVARREDVSQLAADGTVELPAHVRERLGFGVGEYVYFLADQSGYRIVSAAEMKGARGADPEAGGPHG